MVKNSRLRYGSTPEYNTVIYNMEYIYDGNGILIEQSGNENEYVKVAYKYNSKGEIVSKIVNYTHQSKTSITTFDYTKNTMEEKQLKNDHVFKRIIFEIDNYGNVVKAKEYDAIGKLLSNELYKYTYDSMGNILTRIKCVNFVPVEIIENKITYY